MNEKKITKQMPESKTRVGNLLNLGLDFLKKKDIGEAYVSAERLLMKLLVYARAELFINWDSEVSEAKKQSYFRLLKLRAQGFPLQYLVGEIEFMDFKFRVNKYSFIPRPETELLLEKLLAKIKMSERTLATPRILDLGTGCGNIAISLAKYLPQAKLVALDISGRALTLASENAKRNNVASRIKFIQSNLFNNLGQEKFDLIVCNPPYLSSQEMKKLAAELKSEPPLALWGGEKGTEFIERLLKEASNFLCKKGLIFIEIGYNQAKKVEDFLQELGFEEIETFKDYNNLERVICAQQQ